MTYVKQSDYFGEVVISDRMLTGFTATDNPGLE